MELSELVTNLREDYRRANRNLDRLAAEGVYVELSESNASAGGYVSLFIHAVTYCTRTYFLLAF